MADDRLSLPPERDVSPQLRAQVLLNATDPTVRPARPPRRWAPVLAGLAAAAVVVAVTVFVLHDDPAAPPIAGGPTTSAPTVKPHESVGVDVRPLTDPEKRAVRADCLGPDPDEPAGVVLSARLLRSADGNVMAAGFANADSGNQYFCTPFGQATVSRDDTMVSMETPVIALPGSHIRDYTPDQDGSGASTVVDGAWFAVSPAITAVEARLVVDGDAGEWHATQTFSSFVFASAWRHLSAGQVAGDVRVEFRALTADGQQLAVEPVD